MHIYTCMEYSTLVCSVLMLRSGIHLTQSKRRSANTQLLHILRSHWCMALHKHTAGVANLFYQRKIGSKYDLAFVHDVLMITTVPYETSVRRHDAMPEALNQDRYRVEAWTLQNMHDRHHLSHSPSPNILVKLFYLWEMHGAHLKMKAAQRQIYLNMYSPSAAGEKWSRCHWKFHSAVG